MRLTIALAAALLTAPAAVTAGEFDAELSALAAGEIARIAADPAVIDAIRAQNARLAGIAQGEVDRLDGEWRAQVGAGSAPLIAAVLGAPASSRLVAMRDEGAGLYTEIFAMDAVGLNVAASDVTSDYWQGDEAKWQATYAAGAGAVHISDVEFDESTQTYQAQVSVTVTDPADGAAIGALTVGVNVEML